MQIVFHNVDRETLKNLNSITIPRVVGQVAVKHSRVLQSFKRMMLMSRLHVSWTSEPVPFQMILEWRWSCMLSRDVQFPVLFISVKLPVFRKGSKFIHWLFLMSFTCMASISVADELILEISCPEGSPA